MFKVVLVDDEPIVREALGVIVDWQSIGFDLVAVFEEGKTALEYILHNDIDVLITDICMPVMDGMELAREVFFLNKNIEIIILTGYDEFKYAKEAINYKIREYILKPITPYELKDMLGNLYEDLIIKQQNLETMKKIQHEYRQNLVRIKNKDIEKIIRGECEASSVFDKDYDNYAIAIIDAKSNGIFNETSNTVDQISMFIVYNVFSELCEDYQGIKSYWLHETSTIFLLGYNDDRKRIFNLIKEFETQLKSSCGIDLVIGLGKSVQNFSKINLAYKTAVKAREYFKVCEKTGIYDIEHINMIKNREGVSASEMIAHFNKLMFAQDTIGISELIDEFSRACIDNFISLPRLRGFFQALVDNIVSIVNTFQISEDVKNELKNDYFKVCEENSLRDMVEKFKSIDMQKLFGHNKIDESKKQIYIAISYIDENFNREDLTLKEVCQKALMSVSYFSLSFKNITGETFTERITRLRIEKAKELLISKDLKNYEIAALVGYSDPHYFANIFKKMTGMTAKEFKNTRG